MGYNLKQMTTVIEDAELNTELQELYLVSKRWLADRDFLQTELEFLKKRFKELDLAVGLIDPAEIIHIEKEHADLKKRIMDYSHKLEPLITDAEQQLDITLIETYAQIETELNKFSQEIQSVKSAALALTKEGLKKRQGSV